MIDIISTLSLSTISRPSIGAVVTSKVSPLRQVGLAQNNSARLPQLRGNSTLTGHLGTKESIRASGVVHLVQSGNVVLDDHWDTMERTEDDTSLALCIEVGSDIECIWIDLSDDGQVALDLADAGGVRLD